MAEWQEKKKPNESWYTIVITLELEARIICQSSPKCKQLFTAGEKALAHTNTALASFSGDLYASLKIAPSLLMQDKAACAYEVFFQADLTAVPSKQRGRC